MTIVEPGGYNSAKAAISELPAIKTDQPPGLLAPYKRGDVFSIINSCVKSAVERFTAYQYFWVFSSYFFKVWRSLFLPTDF